MILYFEKSMEIAPLMEPAARESSSLKFVASMLFIKYEGDIEKKTALDHEMTNYFGKDWKVSVEKPKYD
jgi:hypothetical protein